MYKMKCINNQTKCVRCTTCCRVAEDGVYMKYTDVKRMAEYHNMNLNDFCNSINITAQTEEEYKNKYPFIMNFYFNGCLFLKNNSCSIYDIRPLICKQYPNTEFQRRSQCSITSKE